MHTLSFEGIGTHWAVLLDHNNIPKNFKQTILKIVTDFDHKYSRFIDTSLISQINNSKKKSFRIDDELQHFLVLGLKLSQSTHGAFDLNCAGILENYGYDKDYSFIQKHPSFLKNQGSFSLKNNQLIKNGPVRLDLGAFGKGVLIDKIADYLKTQNLKYFLVDGGGDMTATTKRNDSPWRVALEHPTDPAKAIGQIELKNQSLASSAPGKRTVGKFHHLLNATTGTPVRSLLASYVLAPTATIADGIATALFVSPKKYWAQLIKKFPCDYLTILPNLTFQKSAAFPASLFLEAN